MSLWCFGSKVRHHRSSCSRWVWLSALQPNSVLPSTLHCSFYLSRMLYCYSPPSLAASAAQEARRSKSFKDARVLLPITRTQKLQESALASSASALFFSWERMLSQGPQEIMCLSCLCLLSRSWYNYGYSSPSNGTKHVDAYSAIEATPTCRRGLGSLPPRPPASGASDLAQDGRVQNCCQQLSLA